MMGHLGGSVCWASDFGSGHDLTVRGFEPRVGLCADSSEPEACLLRILRLPLNLPLPCSCSPSLSFSKMNKHWKKKKKEWRRGSPQCAGGSVAWGLSCGGWGHPCCWAHAWLPSAREPHLWHASALGLGKAEPPGPTAILSRAAPLSPVCRRGT